MIPKIVAGIATIAIIGGAVYFMSPKDYSKLTNGEMLELCIQHANLALHIHPTLEIIVNGKKEALPKDIGVTPSCMRPLHTHDDTGTLHIEAPIPYEFTLGNFFTIWGRAFDADKITSLTVNGTAVETGENTLLHDKDAIVITYGK